MVNNEVMLIEQWRIFCVYTVSQKNLPDIFDCNLKINY